MGANPNYFFVTIWCSRKFLISERQNAGLNITCASRVFLLESVVHHSFEVQAIARIDRLGQTRPTEGTRQNNAFYILYSWLIFSLLLLCRRYCRTQYS